MFKEDRPSVGLEDAGVERLYAGHCTGIDEYAYLKAHFGSVESVFVGREIKL